MIVERFLRWIRPRRWPHRVGPHGGALRSPRKAGLPEATFPAFSAAFDVLRDFDEGEADSDYKRATRLIDGIVKRYQSRGGREIDAILALLRRFAMEARRDAARTYAAGLLAAA